MEYDFIFVNKIFITDELIVYYFNERSMFKGI